MDPIKVSSLEEAQKHFLQNDAVGQVPAVICVKDGKEQEAANLAEAEAFFTNAEAATASSDTAAAEDGKDSESADAGQEDEAENEE